MPPPKPTKFCGHFMRTCRQCGYKFPHRDEKPNCPQCGVDRKCGKPVVKDFSECQDHGGPNPYSGKYGMQEDLNKFPIVKLAQRYRSVLGDSRILSLRASIEVVRGRIAQLAERIDFNDAPDRLVKLHNLWADYVHAKDADKRADMVILEKQIPEQFDAAREDYLSWKQMLDAMDLDRKLVDSEIKVVKELHAIITAEDAYDLMAKVLSIILRVFPEDKRKLRQVQYEFVRLIGDRPINLVDPEPDDDTLEVEDITQDEPLYAEKD